MNEPNDEFETRLRRQLQAKAGAIRVRPDERDLFARSERRARRARRGFVAVLAATLLIGPIGGFAVGRAGDAGDRAVTASSAPTGTAGEDDGAWSGYVGEGDDYWQGESYERLGARTTSEGIELRLYASPSHYSAVPDDGNPTWDPPAWCRPAGAVRVGVVSPVITGVVLGDRRAAARDKLHGALRITGGAEGQPVWVVIAQADDADSVVATFPGGAQDVAEVHDGLAVLASRVPASVNRDPATLYQAEIGLESQQRGSRVATASASPPTVEEDYSPCQAPPPSLPEPGEQPADVEAARAGVIKAYETVLDGGDDPDTGRSYLEGAEDLTAVFEAMDAWVVEHGYAEQSKSATGVVNDLVFDKPDHAWVLFVLLTGGSQYGSARLGEAVFVDGQWKMATETWCSLISPSGLKCP
jgi:hypothetical protein